MQVVALVLALLVGLYLVATIRLLVGKPVITHDYLADFNAIAAAVPADERAWPKYREALLLLGERPEWQKQTVGPGHEAWGEVERYLEENRESLAIVRRAATRPGLGFVTGFTIDEADRALWPHIGEGTDDRNVQFGLFGVLLPYLGDLRRVAQLLQLDAHRAAGRGDGALAADNIEAILGISEHVREVPALINDLVSMALIDTATTLLGDLLAENPEIFTDRRLQGLAHRLSAVQGGRIRVRLSGERYSIQDLIQRLYTDDGDGDGRVTASGLQSLVGISGADGPSYVGPLAPVAGLLIAGRRAMNDEFTRWFSLAEIELSKPLWRQDVMALDRRSAQLRASRLYSTRYFPITQLIPALTRAGRKPELITQRRDAVSAALALELYRRRSGSWPEALGDLVPDLLPAVPLDRFDGRPLRYRLVDGNPILYSVGADKDDDGGRPPLDRHGQYSSDLAGAITTDGKPIADGDWVLWSARRAEPRTDRAGGDVSGADDPS